MTTSETLVRRRRNSSSSSRIWGQNVLTVKRVLAYLLITVLCSDQLYALATNLGSKCQHDMDCTDFIKGSTCSVNGYCECAPYFVQYNATSCLSSQLLGGDCILDDQCTMKVSNSSCLDGACRCVEGFLQFRKHTCLGPAHPGAVCYSHAHCQMFDGRTHCDFLIPNLFGRCQCTAPARLNAGRCIDASNDVLDVIATTALLPSSTTPRTTTSTTTTTTTTTRITTTTTTTTEAPPAPPLEETFGANDNIPVDSIEEAEFDDVPAKVVDKPTVEDNVKLVAPFGETVQTTPQQALTTADVTSTEGMTSAAEQSATIAPELPATEDYPYKIEDDYIDEHDVQANKEEHPADKIDAQQHTEEHIEDEEEQQQAVVQNDKQVDTMNFDYEISQEESDQSEASEEPSPQAVDKVETANSEAQDVDAVEDVAADVAETTEKLIVAEVFKDDLPSSNQDVFTNDNSQPNSNESESESVADAQNEVVTTVSVPEAVQQKIDVIPDAASVEHENSEHNTESEDNENSSNVDLTEKNEEVVPEIVEDKGTEVNPEENNDVKIATEPIEDEHLVAEGTEVNPQENNDVKIATEPIEDEHLVAEGTDVNLQENNDVKIATETNEDEHLVAEGTEVNPQENSDIKIATEPIEEEHLVAEGTEVNPQDDVKMATEPIEDENFVAEGTEVSSQENNDVKIATETIEDEHLVAEAEKQQEAQAIEQEQQQDVEQFTDAPLAIANNVIELNEAIKPDDDDVTNELPATHPQVEEEDEEQNEVTAAAEEISLTNSNSEAVSEVNNKPETTFQTNDNGNDGSPQELIETATAIETEREQLAPVVEQEVQMIAEQHEVDHALNVEEQHGEEEDLKEKEQEHAPQIVEIENIPSDGDNAVELATVEVPTETPNQDIVEMHTEEAQNIEDHSEDIISNTEQTQPPIQESSTEPITNDLTVSEKDSLESETAPEVITEISNTADSENQITNEDVAIPTEEDNKKDLIVQPQEQSDNENEIESEEPERNQNEEVHENQQPDVLEMDSNAIEESEEDSVAQSNENVVETIVNLAENSPPEVLNEEVATTIQPVELDYSNVESFEQQNNEATTAADTTQIKAEEVEIVEDTLSENNEDVEDESVKQSIELTSEETDISLNPVLDENESIADILNDLINEEQEEAERTTPKADKIDAAISDGDLVADETEISESNVQTHADMLAQSTHLTEAESPVEPQILPHPEVAEGTTEFHVNDKLITFYPDMQAVQNEHHLEEPAPAKDDITLEENEEGSAFNSINLIANEEQKHDLPATTPQPTDEELERTLSPEELPFDMSMDEIHPHELESDNLILESTTHVAEPLAAADEVKESSTETDEANEVVVETHESSGDGDVATANPNDILEITTQTMLGLASRVTLMEPAAPVVTTLKPLMAVTAAAAETDDNDPTPEPAKEVSFLESIMTTKATTEIRKRVELGLEAVSLGLSCINDKQCQLADPNTVCSERGVCDCASASTESQCSAARTGCSSGTFQCRASGVCISWFFVCDGRSDCNDASDEECTFNARLNQTCPAEAFQCERSGRCISRAALCDGRRQCPHGEDEIGCSALRSGSCPPHTFRCKSGECLPEYEYCNAIISCKDGSDEPPHLCGSRSVPNFLLQLLSAGGLMGRESDPGAYCPHKCSNGRCRSTAIVCSGRDGCGDGTDEQTCAVCRCAAPAFLARHHRPMPLW